MTHLLKDKRLYIYVNFKDEQSSASFYAGQAHAYLADFLKDKKLFKYAGWDLKTDAGKKQNFLKYTALNSCFYASSYLEGQPLAAAWATPIGKAAQIHFLIARQEAAAVYKAAEMLLSLILKKFPCLIALIPAPFYGAHKLARSLGFVPKFTILGACYLADIKRYADGKVYLLEGDKG